MAALPYPKYSIARLYLFPYYPTRDEYERLTGQVCPPWDRSRRSQRWAEPAALESGDDFVIYDRVLATDPKTGNALAGADAAPYTKKLILPVPQAATVNIPPSDTTLVGAVDLAEVPCPMRALEPNEKLFFDPNALGAPAVKNTDLYGALEERFTAADRATLQAIARKLGA